MTVGFNRWQLSFMTDDGCRPDNSCHFRQIIAVTTIGSIVCNELLYAMQLESVKMTAVAEKSSDFFRVKFKYGGKTALVLLYTAYCG